MVNDFYEGVCGHAFPTAEAGVVYDIYIGNI